MPSLPDSLRALIRAVSVRVASDDLDAVDVELLKVLRPLFELLARRWYRMRVEGLHKVPEGKAIVVINHESGITFLELFAMGGYWIRHRYEGREPDLIHGLGHSGMFRVPGVGRFLVRCGGVEASPRNAERIFARGRKILVAPGGNLEAFRPWTQRFRIRFGGHRGFARLALRHRVPVVPAVFAGGHESFVVLHDGRFIVEALDLHRRLRLDTFPLVLSLPWGLSLGPLFHLPLPTRCDVRFLDPIDPAAFGPPGDEAAAEALYEAVTGAMQGALTEMGARRQWPVIG